MSEAITVPLSINLFTEYCYQPPGEAPKSNTEINGCNILYLVSISINLKVDLERNPSVLDFLK